MATPKGTTNNPAGKTRGARDAVTVTAKDSVRLVFQRLGGVKHMQKWAEEHPSEFYKLYAKLIPVAVEGSEGGPLTVIIKDYCDRDHNPE